MDEADIAVNIEKYISIIKDSERACDTLYESRLSICRSCDQLISGSCLKCGCYVEIRAALKNSACPCSPAKW